MGQACIEDGDWSPPIEGGEESQMDPSHRPHTPLGLQNNMRKKSERTYAKNAAVDKTYQVKVNKKHHGELLEDMKYGVHYVFDQVLNKARVDLEGNDLGHVVIQHDGLHDPIFIPLQPWIQLDANKVMDTIEKVMNSNQNLAIDENMDIAVGTVDLPKGGSRYRIAKINGKNNSLKLKTSIMTIENKDQLCMAKAIGVS